MSNQPSARLKEWLESWIANAGAGDQLPAVPDLSKTWNVSTSTVRRILEELQKKGLIVRIRGRGSIVTPGPGVPPPEATSAPASWENTADALAKAITRGQLRARQPLPSIKRLCLEFGISRASAIRAYRQLVAKGFVEKVGKRFWIGSLSDHILGTPHRRILMYKDSTHTVRYLFSDPEHDNAAILRAMEKELVRLGYLLEFADIEQIESDCKRWKAGAALPQGVLIYSRRSITERIPKIADVADLLYAGKTSLVIVSGIRIRPAPQHCILFSPGSPLTQQMRKAAAHIVQSRTRSVAVFLHEEVLLSHFQRLYPEIKVRSPECAVRFVVLVKDAEFNPDHFFADMPQYAVPHFLSKYPHMSFDEYKESFYFCQSVVPALQEFRKSDAWLFSRDSDAAQALDWAARYGIRVPGDIQVLGFTNDPAYFEYAISACIKDDDQAGYLLAHALIRDFPIARTSQGFIKTDALLMHRKTTR